MREDTQVRSFHISDIARDIRIERSFASVSSVILKNGKVITVGGSYRKKNRTVKSIDVTPTTHNQRIIKIVYDDESEVTITE